MEDRLESVLQHSGKWHTKEGKTISIYRKVKLVEKLAEQKKSLAEKYFPTELTRDILQWKDDRNTMIHALLKQSAKRLTARWPLWSAATTHTFARQIRI